MKTTVLITALTAACASVLFGASLTSSEVPNASQLQVFPKNLARQHYGANLFVFDKTAAKFVPTEAAAAWLDEDPVTGWSVLPGKQHYVLQFAEPQLVTNFGLSAKSSNGTLTVYTGDQLAAPGDASWTVAAKGVSMESVNDKTFKGAINKTTKYVLLETDVADPSPIYSLYVYGEKAAASESIVTRPQPVDLPSIGEFVNQRTAFNVAALYADSRVTFANAAGSNITWQRAIDDSPETSLALAPSKSESGLVVRFGESQPIARLSVQGDASAKGTMDVFLLSQAPDASQPVGLEGIAPSVSIKFDGTSARGTADIDETNAVAMVLRWNPEAGSTAFNLRDVAAFANLSLTDHEVTGAPPAIASNEDPNEKDKYMKKNGGEGTQSEGKDGKEVIAEGPGGTDGKSGKAVLPPVELGPTNVGGFTPGGLGFPPRTFRNPVSQ